MASDIDPIFIVVAASIASAGLGYVRAMKAKSVSVLHFEAEGLFVRRC
jgi:hypothetical protein